MTGKKKRQRQINKAKARVVYTGRRKLLKEYLEMRRQ